jgi:hypothetical protein
MGIKISLDNINLCFFSFLNVNLKRKFLINLKLWR